MAIALKSRLSACPTRPPRPLQAPDLARNRVRQPATHEIDAVPGLASG